MAASWLIGSRRNLPAQTLTINGDDKVITEGSRYLFTGSSALSLLAQVKAAMDAVPVAGAAVVLTRSRKVKISAGGVFTCNFPADGELRSLLGFSGNLAGAASYVATSISPLLWSPAKTETPTEAPLRCTGHRIETAWFSSSPFDGTTACVTHGSRTFNQFKWGHVPMSRIQTIDELGGEWVRWWREVAVRGEAFKLWRADEDTTGASTAAASLTLGLGPYALRPTGCSIDWAFDRSRGLEQVDRLGDVALAVQVVPELG